MTKATDKREIIPLDLGDCMLLRSNPDKAKKDWSKTRFLLQENTDSDVQGVKTEPPREGKDWQGFFLFPGFF